MIIVKSARGAASADANVILNNTPTYNNAVNAIDGGSFVTLIHCAKVRTPESHGGTIDLSVGHPRVSAQDSGKSRRCSVKNISGMVG